MKEIETQGPTLQLEQEQMIDREPTIELLGTITERFDKYGPNSEPSFRRP